MIGVVIAGGLIANGAALAVIYVARTIVGRQRARNADMAGRIAVNEALMCIKGEAFRAYDDGAMSAADLANVNRWELQR